MSKVLLLAEQALVHVELCVSLVDTQNPGSTELPEDAGAFLQCVQKVVGIGNDGGWPGT